MSGKIIGVTVGTPTSARKIENDLKPVKSINGKAPDAKGNVDIENALGYTPADAEKLANQQTAIDGKLPKNMGAANAGKILVVGTDGNLTLTDMPEASGDVTGTFDESNNLLMSGDIADGTYPLKWKMPDGTYADAGSLVVSTIIKPDYTNILEVYDIVYNRRWSGTSNAYSDCNGMVSIAIPLSDVLNKTIYMKGFTKALKANGKGASWYIYSGTTKIGQCKSTAGDAIVWTCPALSTDENNVSSIKIDTTSFSSTTGGDTLYINLALSSSAAISESDLADKIITIDAPIA